MKTETIGNMMADLLGRCSQIPKDLQYVGEVMSIGRQLEFWNNKAHKIALNLAWNELSPEDQKRQVNAALAHDAK